VDGMKYTKLEEHLEKNGEIIKEQLRGRKYKPQPVCRVEIPKPDGARSTNSNRPICATSDSTGANT